MHGSPVSTQNNSRKNRKYHQYSIMESKKRKTFGFYINFSLIFETKNNVFLDSKRPKCIILRMRF